MKLSSVVKERKEGKLFIIHSILESGRINFPPNSPSPCFILSSTEGEKESDQRPNSFTGISNKTFFLFVAQVKIFCGSCFFLSFFFPLASSSSLLSVDVCFLLQTEGWHSGNERKKIFHTSH